MRAHTRFKFGGVGAQLGVCVVLDYPLSIIGYFCVGMVGAITFLFLLLMYDKRVRILENDLIPRQRWMGLVYVVLGGALSVVVNLASNPDFGATQITLAFAAGMGWPAIAAGFSASKRVGEIDAQAQAKIEKNAKTMEAYENQKLAEREKFYKSNYEQQKKYLELTKKLLDKELDEARAYFARRLSSIGGD